MTKPKNDIRELANQALDAFWQLIAKRHPEAKTGDLSPWSTIKLQDAAEDAIEEWLDNNCPTTNR